MKLESLLDFYLVAQGVERLKESVYPCQWPHEQPPMFEKAVGLPPVTSDTQGAADKNRTDPAQTVIDAESGGTKADPLTAQARR